MTSLTRKTFHKSQITDPSQLTRGKIITYHHYNSALNRTDPQKMVILEGETPSSLPDTTIFKGLFLNEDGSTWEFWPALADCSVIPYENSYYNNLSYLVDTGETMTEEEILVALSKNKNK